MTIVGATLICPHFTNAENDEASIIDVGAKKQIFLDGFFIDSKSDVRLTMHKPTRDGKILIQPDHPWEMDPKGKEQRIGLYIMFAQSNWAWMDWDQPGLGPATIDVQLAVSPGRTA